MTGIGVAESPMRGRRLLHAGWVLAILFGLTVAAAELVVLSRFTVDDAFISLRYARNFANGMGLVYNPGERVEGFSNPLLVFLAALAFRLGVDGLVFAKVLGLVAYATIIVLLLLRVRVLGRTQRVSPVLWAVPLAITAPAFGLTFYAGSGLETVIAGALILFVTMRAARAPHSLQPWLAMIPLALVRPEAPAYVLVPALARWWRSVPDPSGGRAPVWKRHLGPMLFGLALLLALLARVGYYGTLVPNTFHAKIPWDFFAWIPGQGDNALINSIMWPIRGFDDIVDFATATGLILLVVLIGFLPEPRSLTREAKLALLALAIGLGFQKYAGGDWMIGARFMVPLIPVAGLLWIEVVAPWCRRITETSTLSLAGIIATVLIVLSHANTTLGFMQLTDWRHAQMTTGSLTRLGRWVGDHVPEDWLMYSSAIGAAGYYGRCRVMDAQGLVSRDIAMLRAAGAHDSVDSYVARIKPEMLMEEAPIGAPKIERKYATYVKAHEEREAGYGAQIYVREDLLPRVKGMVHQSP